MDTWASIAVGVIVLVIAAAWVLGRKSRSAVEDFGESRVAEQSRPANSATASVPLSELGRMLVEEASRQTQMNLSGDPMAMTRINEAANKAQVELRQKGEAEINLPYIAADAKGPKHFAVKVSRDGTGRVTLHP